MVRTYRLAPRPRPRGRSPPGDELWDLLGACHRLMRAELRAVVLRHGVYLSEYRALARLRSEPRTPSQLAESLGLTPASMTDLARQLERRGWVRRGPNPADRRSQLLEPTPTGRAAYAEARREFRARLAEVYSSLPPPARRYLARGLPELSRVLVKRSGGGAGATLEGPSPGVSPTPVAPATPARRRSGGRPHPRRRQAR